VDQRLHAIAAREWRVEPGGPTDEDEAAAAVVEEILERVPRFAETRYELAHAVFTGSSYAFIGGSREFAMLNDRAAMWWIPSQMKDIDRRRFRWMSDRESRPDGSRPVKTWLEYWSIEWEDWRKADPERFIRHVYNNEEARLAGSLRRSTSITTSRAW